MKTITNSYMMLDQFDFKVKKVGFFWEGRVQKLKIWIVKGNDIMKNYRVIVSVVFISFLMAGCSTWSSSSIDAPNGGSIKTYTPRNISEVVITQNDFKDRPYEVLGDITATVNKTTVFNANPTKEMVNKKLQEKAASIGADAVILVRYGELGASLWSWGSLEGKGRAIKFKN